ncbi:MAG: hypothetical protein E6Q40_05030 [Cupriavidus sp.]|nr:MAG: hypothetical protein E6Q40_05030 [Cupriavidus sp.]
MSTPTADARAKVFAPATALIVTAIAAIVVLMLSLVFSVWLLTSGLVDDLPDSPLMAKRTQVTVRITLNIVMQVFSFVVLFGAVGMKNLRNLSFARTACVLALVPCIGPCCLLGIPCGIWGLVTLSDPHVRKAFES